MASLDMGGSPSADAATAAQAERWEKIGRWLMAGYWLAMLAVVTVGGLAAGH